MGKLTKTGIVLLSSLILASCTIRYSIKDEIQDIKEQKIIDYKQKLNNIFKFVNKNMPPNFSETESKKEIMGYNNLLMVLDEDKGIYYTAYNYHPFSREEFGEEDVLKISFFQAGENNSGAKFTSYTSSNNSVANYYYTLDNVKFMSKLDSVALDFGHRQIKKLEELLK